MSGSIGTTFSVACLLFSIAVASEVTTYAGDVADDGDPGWLLLHEPAARKELKLTAAQQQKVGELADGLDLRFFRLRNRSREEFVQGFTALIDEARTGMQRILTAAQQERWRQLQWRQVGTAALLRDDLATALRLSSDQRAKIREVVESTQRELHELQKKANDPAARTKAEQDFTAKKTDEQKKVLALLKPEQQRDWRQLLGADFDRAQLGRAAFKAPELIDSGEWLNAAAPLSLKELRGRVVVIHFYACGCINCVRNLPWYRDWHSMFRDQPFTLIGIHTPETEAERKLDFVRQKAAAEKLTFPILVDGQNKNWNAWGNSMWPTVYVLDKRGYLRRFWMGELNWQGADGEKQLRATIETLLAEKGE